jgi:hypothetical protein
MVASAGGRKSSVLLDAASFKKGEKKLVRSGLFVVLCKSIETNVIGK